MSKDIKIFLILIAFNAIVESAEITNKNKNISISANYIGLLNDLQWFFQGVEEFATVAEKLLPNATIKTQASGIFTESIRVNVLLGMRQIVLGVKEISKNLRKSLDMDNIQQLQHIKGATNFIHEIIRTLKRWFAALRVLVAQMLRSYNRYIPEVLLGKCLGHFIIDIYPDRFFYEYPFLLIKEIISSVWETMVSISENQSASVHIASITTTTTKKPTTDNYEAIIGSEVMAISENEITLNEADEKLVKSRNQGRSFAGNNDDIADGALSHNSFFNLYDVLVEDRDAVIEHARRKHSWQKCFKLYTAESIVRKLKVYFLESE